MCKSPERTTATPRHHTNQARSSQPIHLRQKVEPLSLNSFELTSQQVLAALINAPANLATATMSALEPDDFGTWIHRTIFTAGLLKCTLPDHPEPGSVIIQINRHLLAAGHYQDVDNGLRRAVMELAQITGHPEQLPVLVTELIEQRFRREVTDYAAGLTKYADTGPLADVDAALRQITELRRLRTRILNHAPLQAVPAGGVA